VYFLLVVTFNEIADVKKPLSKALDRLMPLLEKKRATIITLPPTHQQKEIENLGSRIVVKV
jgi:hypothetical protein